MKSLRQNQSNFALKVADLIVYIYSKGYEVTLGDVYSLPCPICNHYGHKAKSKHMDRLAIDLNLFKNGKYLNDTKSHKVFGEYWESIGGIWGGRFNDGNHYEWKLK